MALGIAVASLAAPCLAADATRPRTESDGLGLSVGIGTEYGFAGAQAAYYVQLPRSLFRIVPHAGVGADCVEGAPHCATAWLVGAMGSWGHKHRLLVDLFGGTVTAWSIQLHGVPLDAAPVDGAGVAMGYEYMAFSGFFLRSGLGVAYMLLPPLTPADESPLILTLTLIGLGYKAW